MSNDKNKLTRRDLLRLGFGVGTGAAAAWLASRAPEGFVPKAEHVWQIDPHKCNQCGRCESECVMLPSAVKCVHAFAVCGYCDFCFAYLRPNAKPGTGAEVELCPTGAITRTFIEEQVLPLETDRRNYDDHENIRLDILDGLREKAKAVGLWAPQAPREYGGMALPVVGWAAMYEEANRSIFGPVCFNCAAPDDGNINLIARVGTPAQKEQWLRPIVEGRVRSAFAMTEPAPGGGSDPGMIHEFKHYLDTLIFLSDYPCPAGTVISIRN